MIRRVRAGVFALLLILASLFIGGGPAFAVQRCETYYVYIPIHNGIVWVFYYYEWQVCS